jgi:hypothetical protein
MSERKVGKKLRILLYFGYKLERKIENINKECCYILATCSRLNEMMKNTRK